MSNGPEIWFMNSCGIMWRVPVSPYGQKEVTITNDSPVDVMITRIEYSRGDGTPNAECIVTGLPVMTMPGCNLSLHGINIKEWNP